MGVKQILDYLYPPRCPVCDEIYGGKDKESGICPSCRRELVYLREDYCLRCGRPLEDEQEEFCLSCGSKTHYFTQGRALFSYQGAVRTSLYRLKYANRRDYATVYGRELAGELGEWIRTLGISRIVPIPLHPSRRRRRGYNQAALLARQLGQLLEIPVEEKLLYRVKKTAPLKTMDSRERQAQLRHAFAVGGAVRPGERILLVDDIYTTGTTADAAALALRRRAGCWIFVVSVAIGG